MKRVFGVRDEYLAILLLSVLRTLRITDTPAFIRKCCARSDTPFSVMTRSGFTRSTSLHISCTISSSSCSIRLDIHANNARKKYQSVQVHARRHSKECIPRPRQTCTLVFRVYVMSCFLVVGCQYQHNQLPGIIKIIIIIQHSVNSEDTEALVASG